MAVTLPTPIALEPATTPPRDAIHASHLADEREFVIRLAERAEASAAEAGRIDETARRLVAAVRADEGNRHGIDAFMKEYGLSTDEGIILMCLAEALLRIPDAETADALIAEKVGGGQWERHLGRSDSLFVNASTWGLMLTGRIARMSEEAISSPMSLVRRLVRSSGEPVIRQAMRQAMRLMGNHFVLGRTIGEAIERAGDLEAKGYRFSYDMLGEGARTRRDAERYFDRYMAAIEAVGAAAGEPAAMTPEGVFERPSISVKLSAIHPRFEAGKERLLAAELVPRVVALARATKARHLGLTIDAEEQERLDLTLALFARVFTDPTLDGWNGLGLAVQAYGKRALPVLGWLQRLADQAGKRIPVRLVKGAYWDSEIKWAQERGLADYPVFTEKAHTDTSYLAAMRYLLAEPRAFFPQFATHNAHTVAAVHTVAGNRTFEFQRLHGMGEALYEAVVGPERLGRACRIYAPVGGHEDLLAYLVRRLLENGANTSFVNRIADETAPIEAIVRDPIAAAVRSASRLSLPRPTGILAEGRRNSLGLSLPEPRVRSKLLTEMEPHLATAFNVGPIIDGKLHLDAGPQEPVLSPHDHRQRLGTVQPTSPALLERALARAARSAHDWNKLGGAARADVLEKAADLFERDRARLMAVIVREAGKTLENAQGDIREAVDFLRYYAKEARRLFAEPTSLQGPTGETNLLSLAGRGVFACISPWNFPLAIFTGQVAAALAAGNAVVAKPAEQTPITASLAVGLLHEAGVPAGVLHLATGGGAVGAALIKDLRIDGVAFTGSNDTAWRIQAALAERRGAIVPFIAETGGINAMIADSTALPEQVVRDCIRSAFDSAGQRCSAARVLFLQEEIAERTIEMLVGATEALVIGDPLDYATDVGPVIDAAAQSTLEAHKARMRSEAVRVLVEARLPEDCRHGTYVAPAIYEIDRLDRLEREVFGPILHVIRFPGGGLADVVQAINRTGYGLTLGLQSRIAAVADYVAEHARVGNLYVNRNQIGAVVGVQPFGGEGLSGTGPKAGGPNYLVRFATERVRTTDITATGGNVQLLSLAAGD